MTDTVLVALISGVCSLVGTIGGILASARMTNYRLEQLEKKVEKHNNLIERTYKLEELTAVQEEQIKELNKKLVAYKQIRIVEFRNTEFEKTTSRKIKRHLVK